VGVAAAFSEWRRFPGDARAEHIGFSDGLRNRYDLAHMTGKSVIATLRHRKLGHVDWKAGALLLLGTLPGVRLGAALVMKLETMGLTGPVLRATTSSFVTVTGVLVLRESLFARGNQ